MALKVGFDGRALTSPAAGVRRYASELLRALTRLGEPIELIILGGDPAVAVPPGCVRVPEPWHPPTNAGWSVVGLPLAARGVGLNVLHAPAYTGPFLSPVPVVLTIHDVSYARHPEWFPYRRDGVRRAFYRLCALSADTIITDSTFSASEIRAAYGIDESRMNIVPLGVDMASVDEAQTAPLPHGVRPPFLLHVGDLHARRNLGVVIDALIQVRTRAAAAADLPPSPTDSADFPPSPKAPAVRPRLECLSLVLAGVDRGVGADLRARAERAGARDAVVQLGAVPEPQLRALYAAASLLVYPSLYEGFGLPLLEAMAWRVPVIASRTASIPEVVGDAGLLVDPGDAAAWADAISRALTDDQLNSHLRSIGRRRAEAWTWERTARLTLDVYRRTAHA